MGFSSFTCAKTHLPIMNNCSDSNPEHYTVAILSKGGSVEYGEYDGYGSVILTGGRDLEIYNDVDSGRKKLVLKKFYNNEKFEELEANSWDPGQGHFHSEETIEKWYAQGGFKSQLDFQNAYREFDWRTHLCGGDTAEHAGFPS